MKRSRRPQAEGSSASRSQPEGTPSSFPLFVRGETDTQFLARLDALRAELNPVGLVEGLLADRLLEAVLRLRECARLRTELPEDRWHRAEAQADRLFWRALRELIEAQKRRGVAPEAEATPEPVAPEPAEPPPPIELDPAPVDWRERIALDPKKSLYWPVVRGTQVTAEQVAAMLEENWPIRDILRYFPFLSLDDIRACRDCNAENMCGPWDPED